MADYFRLTMGDELVHCALPGYPQETANVMCTRTAEYSTEFVRVDDAVTCPACLAEIAMLIESWRKEIAKKRSNKVQYPKQIGEMEDIVAGLEAIPLAG